MNSRKPLIIAVIVIVVIVIIGLVLFLLTNKPDRNTQSTGNSDGSKTGSVPPLRTSDELLGVVVTDKPSFKDSNGKLTIKLSAEPQRLNNNWYIIRIVPTTYENDAAKILLYDPGEGVDSIRLIVGPGTAFPNEVFANVKPTVPEIVKAEMNR